MDLDPRHLVQLAAIVETGSFTESAEQLGLAQPALSRNMKTLERCVGAPVLHRGRRGAVPTELGRTLARYGDVIRSANQEAGSAVGSVGAVKTKQLRIAATSLLSEFFLVEPLAAFMTGHPDLICHLRPGTIDDMVRIVALGAADLAIGQFGTLLEKDGLQIDHLIDDRLTVVARPGHPLCGTKDVATRIPTELRWALPEAGGPLRWEIETALRYSGIYSVDVAYETATTAPIVGLVRASDCVAMLPRFALSPLIARGELVELFVGHSLPRRPIGILTQADRRRSPVVASFIRMLRGAARVSDNPRVRNPNIVGAGKKNGGPDTLGRR